MKQLFILFILLCSGIATFGQNKINLFKDEKVKKEGELFGLMKGKDWIIPAKYDELKVVGGYGSYIQATRGEIADLYQNSFGGKAVVVYGLNPAQLNTFLSWPYNDNKIIFNAGKWGFKNTIHTVEAIYDSVFVICTMGNSRDCDDAVGIRLNGKIGMLDNLGEVIIPLGDYVSVQYEYLPIAIEGYHFLGIATISNGARDFFKPKMNNFNLQEQLLNFEEKYIAGKEGADYFKNFWKGLKVFRNAQGALGLITTNGKLFLPAAAARIRYQSLVITASPDGGIQYNDGNTYNKVVNSDTAVISTLMGPVYYTDFTSISFYPIGLREEFNQEKVKIGYDYTIPITESTHCTLCKKGIVTWNETETTTKVIREAETITKTTQSVVADLNDRFVTKTTTYTIPAEVEKTIKTTPRSGVCGNCKGHVDFTKTFRWDASKNAFLGYYSYER
jgi:hypothetical protein